MLPPDRERVRKTKKSNLAPKISPKMLPGHIEVKRVRCGKPSCKCSTGELHGPYHYHRTWAGNGYQRSYIRPENLKETKNACRKYQQSQAELRIGRARYKLMLSTLRAMLREC
jgi:hypothetical protein